MTRLEGLGEKIFLDRYALKHEDASGVKPGDLVLVLVKEDSKFPVKEVGEVTERSGSKVKVKLRNGDTLDSDLTKLSHPLETTPGEMWDRIADAISAVEQTEEKVREWRGKFREMLDGFKLVPGGRIAAGAGTSEELTLFNCYVIPSPKDSRGGIMESLANMTEIMARGGGVGFNLSSLRPRRAVVAGVNGTSSGAVSWGGLFSYTTGLIEQGGSRRGALMLMINDWHPDLLEFITVKQSMGQVTNANLSVCVSNAFMRAVKEDLEWSLVFPDTKDPDYDELWTGDLDAWKALGKEVVLYKTLSARDIWHIIMESAWKSAEPGVVFMEYYNEMSNSWYFNAINSTNPCGEQGLPGWGVCNLSAINLSRFYDEGKQDVDWEELSKATRWSVRFLDNVIDATPYHFPQNEANQKKERRIGLGTMGLAELLIKLQIRYGSQECLHFLEKLYGFMAREAYLASAELAAEKGPFPAFDAELFLQSGFMKELISHYPEVGEAIMQYGIRNVTVLTQAPTGSTGTMVGTSTGIEPYFAFQYFRQSRLGFDKQFVPIAQRWKDAHPGEELPDYFVTAMDLSAKDHIRVQAAIQRWVDSSISKTANCPNDFTIEETKELYEMAYELGCKGVTIYRDGSRDVQVLSTTEERDTEEREKAGEQEPKLEQGQIKEETAGIGIEQAGGKRTLDKAYKSRPQVLRGATYKINTPFGMAYITINDLSGSPGEIFLNVGKAGSDVFAMAEALGRVCSLFLRYGDHGHKVELLIKHLKGIGGSGSIGFGANRVESIADAVAKALEQHISFAEQRNGDSSEHLERRADAKYQEQPEDKQPQPFLSQGDSLPPYEGGFKKENSLDLCPSCGLASLINIEGCKQCGNCGFSKC